MECRWYLIVWWYVEPVILFVDLALDGEGIDEPETQFAAGQ